MSLKAQLALWLAMVATPGMVCGQIAPSSDFNPISATQQGVHLGGVSVFSGYYSSGSVSGFEAPVQSPFLLGAKAVAGVSATIGGSESRERSTFVWSYSPSYFNLFYQNNQFSNNGSLGHRGSVQWTHKLGNSNKWSVGASLNGLIINTEQLYATPGLLSGVASMPTSFDALAAGMLTGKFSDAQLASLLTGAQLQATPEQGYLYGRRLLNLAANVSINWMPTERTSITAALASSRVQPLNGVGTLGGSTGTASAPFLGQNTNATGEISWSHSLSSRTQISASASSTRSFSRLQRGYASRGFLSFGRTMSEHWFVQGRGGAGKITNITETFAAPKSVQYLYGGSLGFKTYAHTFLLSYDRTLGDVYGLGSSVTNLAALAWEWKRPGSNWAISAYGDYQKLHNLTFQNTRSWRTGAGVSRALGPHFFMSVQYVYLQLPLDLKTAGFDSTQNGVVFSTTWSPSRYR